jgi:phage FluMu protein Com
VVLGLFLLKECIVPIEFACPACNSLLRTPDSSAGKKAKCPQCGIITDIPSLSDPASATAGTPEAAPDYPFDQGAGPSSGDPAFSKPSPTGPPRDNPFADASSSPFIPPKPTDTYNPYAAPSMGVEFTPTAIPGGAEPVPTRISFGQTWQTTWKVFSENLGVLLLVTLIVGGMVVIAYISIAAIAVALIFAVANQNAGPMILIVAVPIGLALLIVGLIAYSWIEAGLALVTVRLCRGVSVQATDIFSGGPYTVRVVLLNLLRGVINVTISIVCALIGQALAMAADEPAVGAVGSLLANVTNYIVTLLLLLTTFFIVDRNLDVLRAVSTSMQFMRGNKLTVFGLHLVSGLCVVGVVLLTCGVGALFILPFYLALHAVIYMLATGQRVVHAGQ